MSNLKHNKVSRSEDRKVHSAKTYKPPTRRKPKTPKPLYYNPYSKRKSTSSAKYRARGISHNTNVKPKPKFLNPRTQKYKTTTTPGNHKTKTQSQKPEIQNTRRYNAYNLNSSKLTVAQLV